MPRLANLTISNKELTRLLTKSFFSSGGEAVVCRTNNPHTLYKIFIRGRLKPIPMSDNKLRKIAKIHQLQLENCAMPLKTISNGGNVIGYEMTYDPDDVRFYPTTISRAETIASLEESRDILQYFAANDITYGDVAFRNILFNRHTGKIKFCDIDNIRIGEYPMDLIPTKLQEYYDMRGIDQETDAYMHNILTLNSFGLDASNCDTDDVNEDFQERASQIVETMKYPELFQGEYIIQYIKKKK